jgi:dynein heavy chain 1, cytosolic
MERVQGKVDRSMKLLESLSSERERWESGSRTFDAEMSTIVGDVLLSAAFLAYCGFFDQHYREVMWQEWSNHLTEANIKFKVDLSLTEYLSTADDRLSWQSKSLPTDIPTTENAIILKRFNRYPLIIDPTGQAMTFLLNEYKDRKITVTSFLDEAFLKVLESALRFGNSLDPRCGTSRSDPQRRPEQGNTQDGWSCSYPTWQSGHQLFSIVYHVSINQRPIGRVFS